MRFVLFILLITLSTLQAFGVDNSMSASQSETNTSHFGYDDSGSNREGKDLTIVGQPIGIGITPGVGVSQGLTVGYFLNKNSLVSIDWTFGSSNDSAFINLFGPSYSIDTTTIGINYKKYFGNSFYVKGGVDYIQEKSTAYYPAPLFSSATSGVGQIRGSVFAVEVAVGNQWQWSHFTFGCDWGGIIMPFLSNVTQDDIPPNSPEGTRSKQNAEKNRLFSNAMLEVGRFYVGASF